MKAVRAAGQVMARVLVAVSTLMVVGLVADTLFAIAKGAVRDALSWPRRRVDRWAQDLLVVGGRRALARSRERVRARLGTRDEEP